MKSFAAIGPGIVGLWLGFAATSFCDEAQLNGTGPIESCRCTTDRGPIVARIRAALSAPLKSTGLEFREQPLENVVNFLQDEYQIPIQLDEPALEDAGMTRDEPLSINLQKVSLRSALRLMLKLKGLTYMIRNEVLIITTPEEAESDLITCVYDVRDLVETNRVNPSKGAALSADYDPLIDSITCCISCETWAENGGGEAEVRALPPGLLVISQTDAVHEEIADFLGAVRATLKSRKTAPAEVSGASGETAGRGGYGRAAEMGMEPEPAPTSDESNVE